MDLFGSITGNEKVDSLNNYATSLNSNNPELKKEIGEKSLSLSQTNHYKLGIAKSLNIIGTSYKELGKSDSALIFYKDALKNASELKNNFWMARISSNIAAEYSSLSQFDSTLVYLRKSMVGAAKIRDSSFTDNLLNRMGVAFWRKGEFNRSLKLYKLALKYRRKLGEKKLVVQSLNNIGTAYYNLGNYKIALKYYFEAVDARKEYADDEPSILLNNIGLIYLRLNDISLAQRNFDLGLKSAKLSKVILGEAYSYLNLGDLNMKAQKYQLALDYYKKSKILYEKLGDINGVAKITNKIGEVYFKRKNLKAAQKYFMEAFKICKINGLKLTQTSVLINYCKILIEKGKNKGVRSNLKNAYKLAKEGGFAKSELEILKLQIKVNENLKDYKKALSYQHKYDILKDSLFDKNSLRLVSEAKERYESQEREEKNIKLQKINSIQKIELENRKNTMVFIFITILILFLILIYLVFINIQRKKKNNILLKTKQKIEIINDKLKETNKLLQQSNFTKDKFFSIISHDLKNPFNTLLGATQILQTDFEDMSKEENKELIEIVSNDSQKLYLLLENLLYWANSQTGKLNANKTSILLHHTISEIVSLYQNGAKDKRISIEVKISKSIVIIFDEFMFNTIIRNLLSNAIKFTHIGGNILIVATEIERHVSLKVKDEGIGINEENLKNIFDETSNYRALGTKNEGGTGLGLILCRDFVNENGAKINVKSTLGEGTTFELILEKEK
jgi:signal transduction histidine kinase